MKLITWNIQWGCGLDGRVNLKRIVNEARAMADFDVLCLQEISCGFTDLVGHPGDQPAQLQTLLPGYAVFFGAAVDEWNAVGKRQRFGNLIATRLPVTSVQHHLLPWPADAGVRSMPRMCTEVTVASPGLGAVRIMTTHLEFYSGHQRMTQTRALRALHMQACEQAAAEPLADHSGSPFQSKTHTRHAIVCGDFNFEPGAPEYTVIQQPFWPLELKQSKQLAINIGVEHLQDVWPLVLGETPHAATFRLFDRTYGPKPITCDYVFISQSLKPQVKTLSVNLSSRASDHQPMLLELASGARITPA